MVVVLLVHSFMSGNQLFMAASVRAGKFLAAADQIPSNRRVRGYLAMRDITAASDFTSSPPINADSPAWCNMCLTTSLPFSLPHPDGPNRQQI